LATLAHSITEAIAFHQAGDLAQAERCYRLVLAGDPGHVDALHYLGVLEAQRGRGAEALALIERALARDPRAAAIHFNRGNILQGLNRPAEALASYDQVLVLMPQNAAAHYNRGVILQKLGRHEAALASYDRALAIEPADAEVLTNRGIALYELRRYEEALASYDRALAIKPDIAEALNNRGNLLRELKRPAESLASCNKALAIKPDFAEAHNNLGNALHDLGRLNEAAASFFRALALKPDFAEAHNNLGLLFQDEGKLEDAVACYRKALSFNPDYVEAYYNLGNALKDQGKLEDAVASYHKALSFKPDHVGAHSNLGNALKDQGKLEKAVASYYKALSFKPDNAGAYSNLLFLYGYHALLDPKVYLSLARGWELACVPERDREAARRRVFQRSPLAGRRLKVGYVSGDFRQHATSYFIEMLFTHHDRLRIELFAYSAQSYRDSVTSRLQTLADHWLPLEGMSDAEIRERIEADGIDVLIDLSGHTGHNRLGVFARRAAPVQAHYLGYFASTGLTEMDYWIGDDILTPAETDDHFSEQVWHLPRVWVSYEGKADAPLPDWRPAPDGAVWVGSFNHLNKLTPATLAIWAKVLHALPQGHLLLKTKQLGDAGNRQRIHDALVDHGIPASRVELQSSSVTPDWPAHMAYYNRLDIALDPVGAMGGGTTTCDALWMAVPIVTLCGDRMASRMTASMLDAAGHPEWIAASDAEYIDKVVALARDVELRKNLRATQRRQMAQSPLCDVRDLARHLENTCFAMFERWLNREEQRTSTVT